jgi:hypothetical protein
MRALAHTYVEGTVVAIELAVTELVGDDARNHPYALKSLHVRHAFEVSELFCPAFHHFAPSGRPLFGKSPATRGRWRMKRVKRVFQMR